MKETVQVRGRELSTGDVVLFSGEKVCKASLIYFLSSAFPGDKITAKFARHDNGNDFRHDIAPDDVFLVERPALTPAQQHAEELLALIRECEITPNTMMTDWERRAAALVAKIDPTKPPTLEEALELLGQAIDATKIGYEPLDRRIADVLDRARRAGVVK